MLDATQTTSIGYPNDYAAVGILTAPLEDQPPGRNAIWQLDDWSATDITLITVTTCANFQKTVAPPKSIRDAAVFKTSKQAPFPLAAITTNKALAA